MEIVELSIQGFGRLKDYHVSFTSGLNILFGNNEQGKSTLMAFIRAMFFGFQGSSQAIQKNDRKRYTLGMARDGGNPGFYACRKNLSPAPSVWFT